MDKPSGEAAGGSRQKVVLSWSSGKDSAWTLSMLRRDPTLEVIALATTVAEETGRVPIHDVRAEIIAAQARAAKLPLWTIPLPQPCPNTVYERAFARALERAAAAGVDHWAFGDLFLQDIRVYRERLVEGSGMTPLFPLWCCPARTPELAQEMVRGGLRAVVTCIDRARLPSSLAGAQYDETFLAALPHGVDPCGEYGEFHTLCTAAPGFDRTLEISVTGTQVKDGYQVADVRLRPVRGA